MSISDIIQGKLLLIHKPYQWTSFHAVARIRNAIFRSTEYKTWKQIPEVNKRKFRIGHAGTLDPLATGLLLICTGKETKNIDSFMGMEKEYTGTFVLGCTTPSYDLETEIQAYANAKSYDDNAILNLANEMQGEQWQVPPIFSAIRIEGKRAYHAARAGESIEIKPRLISIHTFEITQIDSNRVHFRIVCSKGTYIRSIARDFGERLGCGAYLENLCRTRIGSYDLKDALTPEEFILSQSSTHADIRSAE